jgi:hypothetical protein
MEHSPFGSRCRRWRPTRPSEAPTAVEKFTFMAFAELRILISAGQRQPILKTYLIRPQDTVLIP